MAERRAGAKGRRLGSSRRRQLREPPPEPDAEQKVPDFIPVGEREHRGPRADLQESQPEGFPGSVKELQVVLAGPGADGTGHLVDQEFPDGLPGQVLGSHERRTPGMASLREHPVPGGTAAEERERFSAFMEQLGTDGVLEDRELWELWVTLRQDEPRLLGNLEHFLAKMRRRIQEAKSQREALEALLNQRVAEHGREVQQLCEALEQQMHQEMQRLQQESEARSLQRGTELWRALGARESQVQQLLSAQAELETRCRSLRRSRDAAGTEKRRLERNNRLLQERLQRIHLQLHDTQERLRAARAAAAPTAGAGSVPEQPGATLPSPQTSPGQEKYRSEMRIRLGSQSDDRPPKSGHHVVWEKAPSEITVPAHPCQESSMEEDPFPQMLKAERISEQSSLLQEMNEAIAALSKEPKPPGPAGTHPLGLPEDVTSCGPHGREAPHGDPSQAGAAASACGVRDEAAAGASERGRSPGAAGQGPEEAPRMVLRQGQVERMGWEEAEVSQGAAGESAEAGEEAQAEKAEGAGHLEGQSGDTSGQGLAEDKELGFIPREPGSRDTQQRGSPAPHEQPPGEVDGPALGLREGTAAAAAAVRSASPSPATTPAGSPAPRQLLPGAAPGLETEAEEGEANKEEAEPWPQGVPIPVSPQGAEGSGAEVPHGEAARGALGQGEQALLHEMETDPCGMQEQGAGTDTEAVQEAGNVQGLEGQSSGAREQGLAGAEEPALPPGDCAGAEAEKAALPQEGDSGADAGPAAPRELKPEAMAGLLRGAMGAGREAAAERSGNGDAHGLDVSSSPSPAPTEAQSTDPATQPCKLAIPARAWAQEEAQGESSEAAAQPPDEAAQGEGSPGTRQPRDEAEQAEAAQGGMEDPAPQLPEARPLVAMQEEGVGAAGRADEAESAGHPEGQSGDLSGQGIAEDEELGFIPSEPGSRDTQQGGILTPQELLLGAAPGLETEAKEGDAEEGEANEEEAEPWPQGVPIPASPQGTEGSGAEAPQGEAARGALGQGEQALLHEMETDPCGMQEQGAGTDAEAVQEAGNVQGLEEQSSGAREQGLAGAEEPALPPGAGAGAQTLPDWEAAGFLQGQPARGAPRLPGEAEKAALPQEGDLGADVGLAAPQELEAVAGLLRGAMGAGQEAAAERSGNGDAHRLDASWSPSPAPAEAQSTDSAVQPRELGAPAQIWAQEEALGESGKAAVQPLDEAAQGEGALGARQPQDEAEQAEAAQGGMEDLAPRPPEARPLIVMQEEGAGAVGRAGKAEGAGHPEGQSGDTSGQGIAEDEELGFIPSEPGSWDTQQGGSPAPRQLLLGAAPGLETEAKEGEAEEGEANEEEAEPWPQGVPIPASPQGAEGSGAKAPQGEAARGALGWGERVLLCEPETDPCGMREQGAGTDMEAAQEAGNVQGSEGQSSRASTQGLAGAQEPALPLGDSTDVGLGPPHAARPREGAPGHVAPLEAHVAPTGVVPTQGSQPWDEAAPGAETPDVGASQGAFAGGDGQIPEESRMLEITQGEGAGVCSPAKEGAQKPEDLQAKMVQPEVLIQAWGALDGEETRGRSADLEVSPLETPEADATQGAGAGVDVLEEPKEAMPGPSTEPALNLLNIPGVETPQGEGTDAEGRPQHGARDLDEQGVNREAGERVWGQPAGFQLKQGSVPPVSEVSLLSWGRRQATLMQEDVLVPDVPPLGVSGQEQVSTQADKVRPDVAPEQLLPKEKLLRVMETEQAAAGPPKEEVAPVPALGPSVQRKDNMGSNPMRTLGESPLRDTANSGAQPSAQLSEEQKNALDVAHGMVSGERDGKQDVGLEASQEAKPRPGAALVHEAGAAPRGSPEACPDPDHLYNVLFVGDSHVGKTSFLYRLHADSFNPHLTATVGLDYQIKNLIVDNKLFTLRLWDSAGQERYHSITKQFFRKADGVVLMYDVTSEYSFADVRYWLSCIQEGAEDGVTVLLLGNKTDCAAERRVPTAEGERLAQEHQLTFYECSAASGHNVSESMVSLIRLLKMQEDQLKAKVEEEPKPARKKWGCC